ncbi:HAD family hydrolase [Sansalvadorimonas verongulae]|uniref:HAD family hydrolase n=1 Tax=Sansalvadorimonas verongulae TaxID=2172824 RepID=UPI0012BCF41F|nr:HAD-IA family hydrolase [Sansalvadorimonas verongulae]MTI14025.1 HAD family hydrolase [Sansalvadorimonas verongulae]
MEGCLTNGIQAILFDLDGTLLDTSEDFIHVLNTMLREDDYQPLPANEIRATVSQGSRGLVALGYALQPDEPGFDTLRNRLLANYKTHTANPERNNPAKLFEGIEPLLAAIEARGIPWGIVTNKPKGLTLPLLDQLDLNERCSVLVCPDDVKNSKPDPESLWKASDTLSCDPAACVYIGDHERDILAGQRAGMKTITALYGFIPLGIDPDTWQADYNSESPQGILEWLDECNWNLPA